MVNPKNLIAAKSALNKEFGGDFEKKTGMKIKGIEKIDISDGVELDEATKWKMGDGKPRGGSNIENIRFWNLPKDQLQYIIKDAGKAMKSNPKARKATTGPGNWADQVNDAHTVLGWRKKNGIKESVELDEGNKPEVTYEFRNSMKAKSFAYDIENSGIGLGNQVGNKVTVTDVDAKWRRAIGQILHKNQGKLLKESVISQLQNSYTSKMSVDININGNIIHITPDISENLIILHDELNEENQTKMREMLTSDSSSFVKLAKFAQER